MNILVISAHPDDEVLGCGGTIARRVNEGHQVSIAILGEGMTSRYAQREQTDPSLLTTLQSNSRRAADILGVHQLDTFDLPDNRFDSVPLLEVVKIIEQLITRIQPEVVYTQHGGDLNIDHVITYRATLTATRPMEGTSVRKLYAYEVASSTEWAFQRFEPRFHPNVFVDIHQTLDQKLNAMRAYETESRAFPHPRSPESLRAIAQRWGSTVGFHAAEAFELVREVG